MMEFYCWVHVSTNSFEEDFDELEKAWQTIQEEKERISCLQDGVRLGRNATFMGGLVNHSHQANPYIEFFHFIGKVAPASYGLFYLRDDEGTSGRNPNKFTVLRMARGVVEELEDTLLSPCVPLIEDDEA